MLPVLQPLLIFLESPEIPLPVILCKMLGKLKGQRKISLNVIVKTINSPEGNGSAGILSYCLLESPS